MCVEDMINQWMHSNIHILMKLYKIGVINIQIQSLQ